MSADIGFEYDPGVKPTEFNLEAGGLEYNDYDNKLYTMNEKKRLIQIAGHGNDIDNGTTGYKNRIINGDFAVWQTGEDWNVLAGEVVWVNDMFKIGNMSDGEFHVFKAIDPSETGLKIETTTAASLTGDDYFLGLGYKMEAMDCYDLNDKFVTISFMIRTNFEGVLNFSVRNHDHTRTYVSPFQVYDRWNYIRKTIRMETDTITANSTEVGLYFSIATDGGGLYFTDTTGEWIDGAFIGKNDTTHYTKNVGDFVKIACVQFEEGKVGTNFERVPVADQWDRCERYYGSFSQHVTGTRSWHYCDASGGYRNGAQVQFQSRMRVAPTITVSGGSWENCADHMADSGSKGFTHRVSADLGERYRVGLDSLYIADARM